MAKEKTEIKLNIIYKDLIDVSMYFGISIEEVLENINSYAKLIKDDINLYGIPQFYKYSKNYIYELVLWNATQVKRSFILTAMQYINKEGLMKVLDYGSGIGSDSILLQQFNVNPAMCDYDSEVVKFARWRCERHNLLIPFYDLSMFPDNLKGEEVDGIICFDVLEHCSDVEYVLKNLHKVLKIDGLLIFSAQFKDCGGESENKLHLLKNEKYKNVGKFKKLLKEMGFDVVSTYAEDEMFVVRKVK